MPAGMKKLIEISLSPEVFEPAISFVGMKTLKFEPHLIRPQTPEKNRPGQWRHLPPKTFRVPKNLIESSLAGNGLSMKLSFAMSWQFFIQIWATPDTTPKPHRRSRDVTSPPSNT